MPTARIYPTVIAKAFNKEVDLDTDTIKGAILSSSYTFDPTHDYFNDVSANEVTGTGYTAGGATLSGKTVSVTAANSWGTSRANSTAYAVGDLVRPATGNGYVYRATTAGTTGGTIPTYPTVVGQTVVDGGVTWVNAGQTVVWFDAADVSLGSSTITGRHLCVYDATGTAATSALIALFSADSDVVSSSGTWAAAFAASGLLYVVI